MYLGRMVRWVPSSVGFFGFECFDGITFSDLDSHVQGFCWVWFSWGEDVDIRSLVFDHEVEEFPLRPRLDLGLAWYSAVYDSADKRWIEGYYFLRVCLCDFWVPRRGWKGWCRDFWDRWCGVLSPFLWGISFIIDSIRFLGISRICIKFEIAVVLGGYLGTREYPYGGDYRVEVGLVLTRSFLHRHDW